MSVLVSCVDFGDVSCHRAPACQMLLWVDDGGAGRGVGGLSLADKRHIDSL